MDDPKRSLDYYVYAYIRRDGTPYYIGKGMGRRAWTKGKKEAIKAPDSMNIIICSSNLTEIGAFAIERRLIRWYGRKDIGTGILRNMTDGGEGCSGRPCLEKTKQKISCFNKGKRLSDETKQKMSFSRKGKESPMKGRKHSDDTKRKISLAHSGTKKSWVKPKSPSAETRKKMSDANKGRVFSKEHIQALSISHKGQIPWNKGKNGVYSQDVRQRISETLKNQTSHSCVHCGKPIKGKSNMEQHLRAKHGSEV